MKMRDRISLKETIAVNYRALKLWRKMAGRLLIAITASSILEAAAPYVPLVFTVQLLEEIAGNRNPQRLVMLTVLLLSVSAAVLLLSSVCKRWNAAQKETASYTEAQQYFTKLLSMDFCLVDDFRTHELLLQIRQNANWSGWGLPRQTPGSPTF